MSVLGSPIQIGKHTVKNRIVLPPLVICGLHRDGHVGDAVVEHYRSFAEGGAGIVIQEATCVSADGRLAGPQLGLWNDGYIDEMRPIVEAVKPSGALLLVQIHYASKQGEPDHVVQVGPSEYDNDDGFHRALSTDEVRRIRDDFIAAARRAERAGYDGVELHGAHGYLLCAFMNSLLNRRDDAYGELGLLNREIIQGIRAVTASDFLVTMRVGVDNPDMATGAANC
jgi:2,4-dienoyl-CoA reductase-like NADH-dependent reductase (Old Yellow Enzyme family)